MKKSLYEQTMDSVKAPERVVEHMLSAVRDSEKKEKIIPMKNRKSNHIKRNVIAASLALALLLGAVFGIGALSPKESPFVITANAAELNDSGYTVIGTLDTVGGEFTETENGDICLTEYFGFDLGIDGERIKSFDYTVINGRDVYGYKDTADEDDIPDGTAVESVFLWMAISADSGDLSLSEEVRNAILDWNDHANFKLGQPIREGYDDSRFNIADCKQTVYGAMLDDLTVEVKVTFDDDTVETRTMCFSCDSVTEDGVATVSAKLV